MARPLPPRGGRERAENAAGWTRIIAVLLIAATAAGLYIHFASQRRPLDPITMCPEEPDAVTVLLVDVTDPMTRPQQKDFRNQLEALRGSIPRYGKLVVARVDDSAPDLVRPVIARCNPGTADDVSSASGNPDKVQAQHDESFKKPLEATFERLMAERPSERSPIFEAVQSVALSELQTPSVKSKPRRLIIVSDLLQHTPPKLNFYTSLPSLEALKADPAFLSARTDLSGIEVELWMLQRPDTMRTQPRALAELWAAAIEEQGGTFIRLFRVSG